MASKKGVSDDRLKLIYQRQGDPPPWDKTYIPCTLATPQEAPSISWAVTLTPSKLGRETHLLSETEFHAALLGLYHPDVIGLQEQRMLSPEPTMHPLWTMPHEGRVHLPPMKGVIEVADRLGYLSLLPRLRISSRKFSERHLTVVFPWSGDLLWALRGASENVYCVNWTIKDKKENFVRPMPRPDGKLNSLFPSQRILARHEIERAYYLDGCIPTIRVTGEDLDEHVSANLRQLFLHHRRWVALSNDHQAEIFEKFLAAFEAEIPPNEVIANLVMRGKFSAEVCKAVLSQAIWERRLRVDLFKPVLINRPLRPEVGDVLIKYQDWFRAA